MATKILVTGGTGYIGSHTVVELQQAGYEVVIIDNLSNSNKDVLKGIEAITGIAPVFVEGDCTDLDTLKKLFEQNPGIKGIINFAASKAVGESVQKPLLPIIDASLAGTLRTRATINIAAYFTATNPTNPINIKYQRENKNGKFNPIPSDIKNSAKNIMA